MLTCFQKRPIIFYNKKLADYCRKTTEDSIKKITEKYNLERNKQKINNPLEDDDNDKPKFNLYGFITFLSISTLAIYFYKRLQ